MAEYRTNHTRDAIRYAQRIADGKAVACKFVKQACERFIKELARSKLNDPKFPYKFDRRIGERVCRFVELMPHIKGKEFAGKTIELEAWQKFILCNVFGWVHKETGLRRFRTAYIEVPRKNAKSTLSSGVALYCLGPDDEAGAEVYSAATTRDQAKIVFNDARAMAIKTPEYRSKYGVGVLTNSLPRASTSSFFQPLSADSHTLDGLNVHAAIIDELHAHKSRAVFDVIDTGTGARSQPLIWIITTAGSNMVGVCYEQRTYLANILKGTFEDDSFFGIIYTIDEEDIEQSNFYNEAVFKKANPNYGVSVVPSDIRRLADKAMRTPSARNNFLTKRLNVWVGAAAAYFDIERWKAAADPTLKIEDFAGCRAILAFDLSNKKDLTALVALIERDDKFYVITKFWLPEKRVETVAATIGSHYAAWASDDVKALTLTPGDAVDQNEVGEEVLKWCGILDVQEVGYDPWNAHKLAVELVEESLPMVEVRPNTQNFSPAMKLIEDDWMPNDLIVHDGNPVMLWCMGNVTAQKDRNDNVFPRKENDDQKIDGAVALITAANRYYAQDADASSPYDDGSVGVLAV